MASKEQVFGVARTATRQEVKSAYRLLARKFHPDHNPGDRLAARRWEALQRAWGEYQAAWRKEDGPSATREPDKAKDPDVARVVDGAKDLTRPFAAGLIELVCGVVKTKLSGPMPGGIVGEIVGKAGQAAIDEAAVKARAKIDALLKRP